MTESERCEETKEQLQAAVADLTQRITTMCIVEQKASPMVVLGSLLTATEVILEVVAYLEQVERARDGLEDTQQKELTKGIANWVGLLTDSIVRGKQRFLEEQSNDAGQITPE